MDGQRFNCSEILLSVKLKDGFHPPKTSHNLENQFSSVFWLFLDLTMQNRIEHDIMITATITTIIIILMIIKGLNSEVLWDTIDSDSSISLYGSNFLIDVSW